MVDELGCGVDLLDQRVATVLVFHRGHGVGQALHAGSELTDLAAHVAEVVGQRAGPVDQPVEVIGAVVDQGGPAGQKGADSAGLIGGSELFRHISGGTGDATDCSDIRQLADSVRHLLQVCEGLRRAQVMR